MVKLKSSQKNEMDFQKTKKASFLGLLSKNKKNEFIVY